MSYEHFGYSQIIGNTEFLFVNRILSGITVKFLMMETNFIVNICVYIERNVSI